MYCSFEDQDGKLLREIEYSRKLYEDQVANVEREERIRNLLHLDHINAIRNYRTTYDLCSDIFYKAQKQVGERLKKDRPDLEALKGLILKDFLNNDKNFKLTKITACGYESYGWHVEFSGYGKTFYISFPVKSKLTPNNLSHMDNGMFSFTIAESERCWKVLAKSYVVDDLAKFIKEYFYQKDETKEMNEG